MRPVRYDLDLRLDLDAGRLVELVRLTLVNDGGVLPDEISLLLNRDLRVVRGTVSVIQEVVPVAGLEALRVNHVRLPARDLIDETGSITIDLDIRGTIADQS